MGLLKRLFGPADEAPPMLDCYNAIVQRGREPHLYVDGQVPDTIDGRFDMIAAVLAMVLLRMEVDPDANAASAHLAERFVDDMDGQLRQIGFGDMIVGKRVGQMMSMLGGRLGAYRDGLAGGDLDAALVRNLYRGAVPDPAALAHVRDSLVTFRDKLATHPVDALMQGVLPA